MTYFLIALVVLVALSPLISMMPSRRQRQIASLRQRAVLCGMTVQLREFAEKPADGELRPYYGRHRQRGDRRGVASAVYRHNGDCWHASPGTIPAALSALLERLPVGVSRVCEDVQSVGLFWDERGEETDVERINEILQELLKGGYLQEK